MEISRLNGKLAANLAGRPHLRGPNWPSPAEERPSADDGEVLSQPNLQMLTKLQTSRGTDDSIDFFFEKRASPYRQQVLDQWIRFSDREPFSTTSLGIVADLCVPKLDFQGRAVSLAAGAADSDGRSTTAVPYHTTTLVLNMDIKKTLPAGEVDFLFVRVVSAHPQALFPCSHTREQQNKGASHGRSDAEVTILDPDGELVASCSQIMLEQRVEATVAPNQRRILGKI